MIINGANIKSAADIGFTSAGLQNTTKNTVLATPFSQQFSMLVNADRNKFSDDDNLLMDNADLSEIPASCNCELCKTDDSVSQDENDKNVETEEAGSDIIFDIFEYCYECEDREHCKHYLGMTGASEEEIEKADIIIKTPFDKYKDIAHEQLSRSLRTSIIYNYNLICPEIEKKPKRDK